MSTERHTFIAELPVGTMGGDQIMVEEFVHEDGTRTMAFAIRETPWAIWGPPEDLTQTS